MNIEIGMKFTRRNRRHKQVETVTDVLKTYNSKGELVQMRYVATHDCCGQTVTDWDIPASSIARALLSDA